MMSNRTEKEGGTHNMKGAKKQENTNLFYAVAEHQVQYAIVSY